MKVVVDKEANEFVIRKISPEDSSRLGIYFSNLSEETKKRFGPHPLTVEFASEICHRVGESAHRYILLGSDSNSVIGYFILDYGMSIHEKDRFLKEGITLMDGEDILFAPSMADEYQNRGLASLVMPFLMEEAKANGARRMVLMGGTQETNERAIGFYEKFGFKKYGGYNTDMFNHDMMAIL